MTRISEIEINLCLSCGDFFPVTSIQCPHKRRRVAQSVDNI